VSSVGRSNRLFYVLLIVLALGGWFTLRPQSPLLSDRDQASVQRAALLTLFVSREHAKQLVFWSDTANLSPTLQLLRDSGVSVEAQQPDTAALALRMPVHLESLATLERQFRAAPDGWEAWFARFPASSGLIALTRPVVLGETAAGIARVAVVVARICGEHCHSAWRVTLARDALSRDALSRDAGRSWRTVAVEPLTLPRD